MKKLKLKTSLSGYYWYLQVMAILCTIPSKKINMKQDITIKQFIKELEELEPKNIIDYIFKGSALNQWMRKNKICQKIKQ